MRPALIFSQKMSAYPADVRIKYHNKTANGKSILSIMCAGIKRNSKITVECSGKKEEEMLEAAAKMIIKNFGGEQV